MEEHSKKKAHQISLKAFLHTFLRAGKNNQRYCFILGSGASREAGIHTGVQMAEIWARELKEKYEENELKELMRELGIESIEPNSKNYFGIYELLYYDNYQEGYAFFEKELEKGTPSLGHYALAKILAGGRHNLVITTNFDSLVEDALFIYTRKHPLVIGHESLTEFMNLNIDRPIVAKIHRSVYFHPFNRKAETNGLAEGWKEILKNLLMVYTPIVIGYAGGDQSLMQFLNDESVNLNGLYWCYWSKEEPSEEIRDLVAKKNGCLVPIEGFDQMMFMISRKLGFDNPEKEMRRVTEERIEKYNKQYDQFESRIREEADKESEVKDTIHDTIREIDSHNEKQLREAEDRIAREESAENYFYRGNVFFRLKMYDKAIADYTQAIEKNPECAEAYNNRGIAYRKTGEYDKAIADYTQALEKNPEYAEAYNNRGYAYDITGEYDKAIADYTQALEKNPEYAEAYNNRGYAYDITGEYDKAIADYTQALEKNPEDADAYYNRGIAHRKIGEYDKAIADYTQALEKNPEYAEAYNNRGYAYDETGEYDKAIADYTQAIEKNPEYAEAYNNRGYAYAEKKEYENAISDYKISIKMKADFEIPYHNLGELYFELKDYENALKYLSSAIKINPERKEPYQIRSKVYTKLGETEKALEDEKRAE